MPNATATALSLSDLPALGADLLNGIFAGIVTQKDGTHAAIVLLPDQAEDLTWKAAGAWAKKLEAELPTRPVAAILFANVKDKLRDRWHWTSEEHGASYAWYCHFGRGYQGYGRKSYEGCAVSVRLIPLSA